VPSTVEERIINQFNTSVKKILQSFSNQGMSSKEVAKKLRCGVSNIRRIAKKYGICFDKKSYTENFFNSTKFLDNAINTSNFLSRSWKQENKDK